MLFRVILIGLLVLALLALIVTSVAGSVVFAAHCVWNFFGAR